MFIEDEDFEKDNTRLIIDKQFVRIGIQENWLPIGVAYKKEGSSEYSYYVSPKKLYEYTGYIYKE